MPSATVVENQFSFDMPLSRTRSLLGNINGAPSSIPSEAYLSHITESINHLPSMKTGQELLALQVSTLQIPNQPSTVNQSLPLINSIVSDGTNSPIQNKNGSSKPKTMVATPDQVMKLYMNKLTPYEQHEIFSYPQIYFIGANAKKRPGIVETANNCGYDNEQGSYIHIPHDHVAYRYEVLKVIGKGSFGQVVKAYDHKNHEHVALKMVRNEKRFHRQAQEEIRILEHLRKQDKDNTMNIIHICYEHQRVYTYIQSRFYRAPEVILGARYGMPIDMWSLGCILAELLTGFPLLPGEDEGDQLACVIELLGMPPQKLLDVSKRSKNFISSKGYPRYCTATTLPDGTTVLGGGLSRRGKTRGPPGSKELKRALKGCDDPLFLDFIRRCLEWDPDARMTPAAALRHAWLRRRLPRPPADKSDTQSSGLRTSSSSSRNSSKTTTIGSGGLSTNKLRVQLSDDRASTVHSRHSHHSTKLPQIPTNT
ncbi:Dual specificity tyrosine-phosphorylation-regulated kinase 2 [Zootermopsis nevadensis]|uniref:dual-specificity kinase n=1 Tax=Zootermopsis nevadensis TaxID=136037 RepID=A0A067R4Q1_ZOONE|nr:Dual specificity tyrosine-phosphorylation-regulated kinase 2 [Zootermopsis nevadensis]